MKNERNTSEPTNDETFSLYRSSWSNEDAQILAETITEVIHSDYEGWSNSERRVIERFLEDVALGCQASRT